MTAPDSIALQLKLDGVTWTDVSADWIVADPLRYQRGILDNAPTARVAGIGTMSFVLNNSDTNSAGLIGYYSPGHANCRSGFACGIAVRLRVTYDGVTRTKWKGWITDGGIRVTGGLYRERRTYITCEDWFAKAAKYEITTPEYQTNKRGNEMIPYVLANMTEQPESTSYATGYETFASGLDTTTSKTTAMAEFQKIANSELGYIYDNITDTYDNVLIFESRFTRNDVAATLSVPKPTDLCDEIEWEDGELAIWEDGDQAVWDEMMSIDFDNNFAEIDTSVSDNMANIIKLVYYPKRVDGTAQVLFTLQKTDMAIAAGGSVSMTCTYKDPTGGYNRVCGKDMITPAGTTDYKLYAGTGGTGSDLTADLDVSATYGTNGAAVVLSNSGATDGYVSLFQLRGYGIYIGDPVEIEARGTASIAKYGEKVLRFDAKYQDDPTTAASYSNILINHYADPGLTVETAAYYANADAARMGAYMALDIGDMITISEDVSGVDTQDYFINGIACEVTAGYIIKYTLYLKYANYDRYEFAKWDEDDWDAAGANWGY